MSGLSRTPGKRVWANPHRGFESRPLRQLCRENAASGPLFRFYPSIHPSSGVLASSMHLQHQAIQPTQVIADKVLGRGPQEGVLNLGLGEV